MHWEHRVDPEWMKARRKFLTASEIVSCLPSWRRATKAQKAGEEIFPAFFSLMMQKVSDAELDIDSFGAMARGHIAEPYAINDYNSNVPDDPMFHWDDVVIASANIGWSPDGLNISQDYPGPMLYSTTDKSGTRLLSPDAKYSAMAPTRCIEVKSYEPKAHAKRMVTPKEKLDERWQIATGMWVVPSIVEGVVLFYSLETDFSFPVYYSRDELEEEIVTISGLNALWEKNKELFRERTEQQFARSWSEAEINADHISALQNVDLITGR